MIQYDPAKVRFYRHVETHPELMGTAGLNFAPYRVSSPRLHMLAAHMGQKPVIIDGEPPRIYTGAEREHAKNLYSISTPCRLKVINIINSHMTQAASVAPPMTIVIFEAVDTGTIDIIRVPQNYCNHQTFGFRYIRTREMDNLYVGQCLEAGVMLAKPDSLTDDGDWAYGLNLRMALIQHEGAVEDGIVLAESVAKRFAMRGYGTVYMHFSADNIPLDIWGNPDGEYTPLPRIGDKIPPSGIIMASREFDPDLAPANMSLRSLQRPNNTDDVVKGMPGGTIVDVRVIKSSTRDKALPTEVDGVLNRYWERNLTFQEDIIKSHRQLSKLFGTDNYNMSAAMYALVKDAYFIVDPKKGLKRETYRGSTLEDTMVIVQYEYIYLPNLGSKFTGRQGDKAVITSIRPDHLMPECGRGLPVHAIMDDSSINNRMNGVKWDEIFINACMETVGDRIREAYRDRSCVDEAWAILKDGMSYVSPLTVMSMEEMDLSNPDHRSLCIEDIETILAKQEDLPKGVLNGIRTLLPTDNPVEYIEAIPALAEAYPPVMEPLLITTVTGKKVLTKKPCLVSWAYIFPLDRQANRFAATSSSKRQHHGIPVKPSKTAKMAQFGNDSPTKDKCEDSTRGAAALLGGNIIAENYDRNLNPRSHQQEMRSIYFSDNPARITNSVPRHISQLDPTVKNQEVIPVTGGRVSEIRSHILRCGGAEFTVGDDGDSI